MTPDRWKKIEELYHTARECEESQRLAFLNEACAGDDALRREVESLLACEGEPEAVQNPIRARDHENQITRPRQYGQLGGPP